MMFYAVLALINVVCFLPLYLLNFRDSPNPFEFLFPSDKSVGLSGLRLMYARSEFTDPFRVNYDFTVLVLLVAAFDYGAQRSQLLFDSIVPPVEMVHALHAGYPLGG